MHTRVRMTNLDLKEAAQGTIIILMNKSKWKKPEPKEENAATWVGSSRIQNLQG